MFDKIENIIRGQGYTGIISNNKTSLVFECYYDNCPRTVKLMVSKTKMTLIATHKKTFLKEVPIKNQNITWNFILNSFPKMEVL